MTTNTVQRSSSLWSSSSTAFVWRVRSVDFGLCIHISIGNKILVVACSSTGVLCVFLEILLSHIFDYLSPVVLTFVAEF